MSLAQGRLVRLVRTSSETALSRYAQPRSGVRSVPRSDDDWCWVSVPAKPIGRPYWNRAPYSEICCQARALLFVGCRSFGVRRSVVL